MSRVHGSMPYSRNDGKASDALAQRIGRWQIRMRPSERLTYSGMTYLGADSLIAYPVDSVVVHSRECLR